MIALMCIKKPIFYMHFVLAVVGLLAQSWLDIYAS